MSNSKDCSRNYPGGHIFFSDPCTPRTHMESEPPPTPRTRISALINLPHYGSNTPWPPGQITSPPPTPRTHCQQNTLHPQDKKVFAAPPPDNFWNSPKTRWPTSSSFSFQSLWCPPQVVRQRSKDLEHSLPEELLVTFIGYPCKAARGADCTKLTKDPDIFTDS